MEVTLAGLELNSVSSASFGARGPDGRFILCGGTYLSSLAKAQLPLHMGGAYPDIPEDLDERTIYFMDIAPSMFARNGNVDGPQISEPARKCDSENGPQTSVPARKCDSEKGEAGGANNNRTGATSATTHDEAPA